jgi:hypothetical protein
VQLLGADNWQSLPILVDLVPSWSADNQYRDGVYCNERDTIWEFNSFQLINRIKTWFRTNDLVTNISPINVQPGSKLVFGPGSLKFYTDLQGWQYSKPNLVSTSSGNDDQVTIGPRTGIQRINPVMFKPFEDEEDQEDFARELGLDEALIRQKKLERELKRRADAREYLEEEIENRRRRTAKTFPPYPKKGGNIVRGIKLNYDRVIEFEEEGED